MRSATRVAGRVMRQWWRIRLAAHRRHDRHGVVPDDIVRHEVQDSVDVLGLPGVDHVLKDAGENTVIGV